MNNIFKKLKVWWEKEFVPQVIKEDKPPEYLEKRIIYCANCDVQIKNDKIEKFVFRNSTLWRYQGKLVCSTCNSDNWSFPVPVKIQLDNNILEKVKKPSGNKEK